ncbi:MULTISPECIES: tetratricopeptide repeat protein [unclassified Neptuniibacter]|jgi:TPR repeat protein|uniref:tetratricopeptide repeat protein n=1 Tax=unclassified Neptuniibacter TaxID=2630693 RepID=UPI0026E3B549|nr:MULTISPECIES: sel1 repeat family protein [unclassified Neptuniibacter]MDO6512791.1 sel1 repeat family protein [Neptuniibacter sp. 2_MG-2023]MDO6593025.1 sel1 repeat family protein [Neptuniibacter sp. 1_MG-2023]
MRFISRLLAPLVFVVAYALFRSSIQQKSLKKHNFVMKLFRFCADNGHKKALSVYGHLLHFKGDGIQNRIQGGIYLQQAAEKGDEKAQYQMGRIFENGYEHYFQPDAEKSLSFYTKAAEQGHQLAIKRLVDTYAQGELEQVADPLKADYWRAKQSLL